MDTWKLAKEDYRNQVLPFLKVDLFDSVWDSWRTFSDWPAGHSVPTWTLHMHPSHAPVIPFTFPVIPSTYYKKTRCFMVLGIIMSHLYRHPKLISIRISLVASIAFNCRIVILTGGDSSVYLQHLQDGRGHSSKPVSELGNFSEWNPSRDFWKYMNIGLDAGLKSLVLPSWCWVGTRYILFHG